VKLIDEILSLNDKLLIRHEDLRNIYRNQSDIINITRSFESARKYAFKQYDDELYPYIVELRKNCIVHKDKDNHYLRDEFLEGYPTAKQKYDKAENAAKKKLKKKLEEITRKFSEEEKTAIANYRKIKREFDSKR
jgi:hypothetical protein